MVPRPVAQPRLRLFCFPHAGGAASAYTAWAGDLPDGVELVAVQPPGRERRFAETPFDRLEPFLDAAYAALRPLWHLPFAFFGHSTGALVGYELARRLRDDHAQPPVHLFASGRWAPHLQDPEPAVHALPREALVAALRRYGGTPEEVLTHDELLDLILPLLRADFALGDTYRYTAGPPLEVPITAMGGSSDPRVSEASLNAWSEHTRGRFACHLLPGDHFYLHTARHEVIPFISHALQPHNLAG